jgi:hypothetical protein
MYRHLCDPAFHSVFSLCMARWLACLMEAVSICSDTDVLIHSIVLPLLFSLGCFVEFLKTCLYNVFILFMRYLTSRDKSVPVITSWRVLGLRLEERPPDMEKSCEYIE